MGLKLGYIDYNFTIPTKAEEDLQYQYLRELLIKDPTIELFPKSNYLKTFQNMYLVLGACVFLYFILDKSMRIIPLGFGMLLSYSTIASMYSYSRYIEKITSY